MAVQRHFIGWDGPVVERVADWLLSGRTGGGAVDLQDTLIVVPTLQAGRRLREVLAWRCHQAGSCLLSAAPVTPGHFFVRRLAAQETAGSALSLAVWSSALELATGRFRALFPQAKRGARDSFKWALAAGELIEGLRHELADGGYTIEDVLAKHGDELEELDRWQDLAALERNYLTILKELGKADSCRAKIAAATEPELDPNISRVVLAAVPDPALLAARALELLAESYPVHILVHAPESESDKFDELGRPLPEAWMKEEIEIPGWDENVFLEESPDAQVERTALLLAGLSEDYGPSDIGIGVPDIELIPFLRKELASLGLPAFDPSDVRLDQLPLGRLIVCLSNTLASGAYVHAADLLRHPDFLNYLEAEHGLNSLPLLGQLDGFQDEHLPLSLRDMLASFDKGLPEGAKRAEEYPELFSALRSIEAYVKDFEDSSPEEAWRSFLSAVYKPRKIGNESVADRQFQQAAVALEAVLRELRELPVERLRLDKSGINGIFYQSLLNKACRRERGSELVDLQGWLELHWTDTPFLALTGANEESVPGGSVSGIFLPDSLRRILRLRDDQSRFGRDAYLLKSMIESRRSSGRVCLIAGRRSLASEPLKPSRLFFRCSDEALPGRAARLFREAEQLRRVPPAELIFQLRPASCEPDDAILKDRRISVTAFSDFLTCPFRFYLQHILKMEHLSDESIELDPLKYGSFIHEVLQIMGSDAGLWACDDAEKLGKKLVKLADEVMAKRYGSKLPIGALAALSAGRAQLEAFAREQVELAADGWEIIAIEQKKIFKRNGFEIRGKIDRIDRHAKTGAIRVIDYKTSKKAESPDKRHFQRCRQPTGNYAEFELIKPSSKGDGVKTETKKWTDLQLPIYYIFHNGNLDFSSGLELAFFNLPKSVNETSLEVWQGFDEWLLRSAVRCLDGVLDDIHAGRFWPPSEKVAFDSFEALFLDSPEKVFDVSGFST